MKSDLVETLERIAAMDIDNGQSALLARNEAREALERLEDAEEVARLQETVDGAL